MPFIVDWLEGHWRGLLEEIWRELTLGNQRRHQRRLRETSCETCHSYRIAWIVQTYKELHRFLLCTDHLYWARRASWVLNKPFISSWLVGIAFSEHLVFERYNIVHAVALVSELWKAHFRIKKMSNVDFFIFFKRYENARNNAGLQLYCSLIPSFWFQVCYAMWFLKDRCCASICDKHSIFENYCSWS